MESWASPNGRGEIEEEQESPASAVADRVFVAVGKELKEGKTTLLWTLQNFHRPIVITHVHRPATMIPLMGGKFPVSQLKEQEVRAYRELEREKMNKCIEDFLLLCSQKKVKADKLVVEMDDVSKGLIELIAQYGITKLVMGAAADKHYSKKLKAPRSKTATTVKQLADSSCHIWFVCKGNLICTREVGLPYGLDQSSMNSPSSVSSSISLSSYSEQLRSRSSEGKGGALKHMHNIFWHRPSSENLSLHGAGTMSAMAHPLPIKSSSPLCRRSLEGYFGSDTWEELPKRILQSSYPSSSSENDEVLSNSDFHSLTREGSEVCSVLPVNMSDENLNLSPDYELEDMGVDTELHHKLQDALIEAENFRREVYKESLRHWRAQRGAFETFRREDMGGDAELYHQLQDTRTEAGSFRREVYKESLRVERDAFEAFLRKDLGFDAELHHELQDFLTKSRNFEREVYKESLGNEKAKRDPFEAFQTEEMSVDAELYHKLQDALSETGNLKREAYEESLRRQRAERDAFEAFQRAKASENMYAKEVKLRKEIEEALERENLELEMIKNQQHELSEELQKMNKEKLELELRITDSVNCIKDLEEQLSTGHHLLSSLQEERDLLQMERDKAVREVKELHQKKEEIPSKIRAYTNLSEFSLSEIEQATHSFSLSLKIGEGGYGTIYKGFLRHTTVAIKMLNPDSMRGRLEFDQEVDLLSRMRHPNLVTLIGACSEAWALIYEYLPNGSLEDSLTCKSNSLPLTWQARTRIAADICSALIFLHSSKPHAIVHGDLKPENILLDANLVSKLSNFGLCRTIVQSDTTTFYRQTHPKGAFVYMDPMFVATGDLTPRSDVYAFGVIILRLLTGTAALGIVKAVQDAIDKQTLHGIIDPTAGDWPFVQAKQLAHLGLRCCEINRKNRPDLTGEVWRVLEPMMKAASFSTPKISFSLITDDNGSIPSYFMCPILQEVMRDPHIAADGFTYEAEALRGWIHSGHKTSPMTNLKLPHSELIPNRALRSAIQEWMQQQLKQF